MLKKFFLTAVAVGLFSTLSLQIAPAGAVGMRGMTCKDAAMAKYPDDGKTRRSWKKMCKQNWRQHQG